MACNMARFEERVTNLAYADRSLCQCCGRVIALIMNPSSGPVDGRCRWCEMDHPRRIRPDRPRLFAK